MKAVILAGGEGTRLRPVSCNRPKPMVRLFDKPVLEHSVALLRRHGFDDITATLQFMPHVITDYFGDGHAFGVQLRYAVETKALGTAGGVAAAAREVDADELLVISGDAVCDFDLTAALQFHRDKHADVTLLLKQQDELLDYGLVMLREDGRVERFIEKPSWQQVFSNLVNTGIYILNPAVLQRIAPDTVCDFARDLFPALLAENAKLYGFQAEGYWCDIGDPAAYLRCHFDALDGKVPLFASATQTPCPDGVTLLPPCYIGSEVTLEPGCTVGPYAVLNSGSVVAANARVERSLLDGARADENARLSGAIVCRGAAIRQGAQLLEGSVIGESSVVGAFAVLHEHSRVWPNKEVADGEAVYGSIITGQVRKELTFDGHGRLSGENGIDFTPEFCLRLGSAIACTAKGAVGIAHVGGEAARVYADLLTGTCNAAGLTVTAHDAPIAAVAAYAASLHGWALSIFVKQDGDKLTLFFFDGSGLPIERETERQLENAVKRGETYMAGSGKTGMIAQAPGMASAYINAVADSCRAFCSVAVTGQPLSATLLRHALLGIGCHVTATVGQHPFFSIDDNGFALLGTDENGVTYEPDRLLALCCAMAWMQGVPAVAVPYHAPACLDQWATAHGKTLLRVGRDGLSARALLAQQLYLRDACACACYLLSGLAAMRMSLAELNRRVPAFSTTAVEVPLRHDRGAIMRALADNATHAELGDGLRLRVGNGWVTVAPLTTRCALRIVGEGEDMETAAELCDILKKRVRKLDS